MEAGFGPGVGRWIRGLLEGHGIELRGGQQLERFEGDGRVQLVVTGGGDELPADMVVLGTGVKPDVMLASAAGLEIGDSGGVKCDARLRTSAPDLYAAGDICEYDSVVHGRRHARRARGGGRGPGRPRGRGDARLAGQAHRGALLLDRPRRTGARSSTSARPPSGTRRSSRARWTTASSAWSTAPPAGWSGAPRRPPRRPRAGPQGDRGRGARRRARPAGAPAPAAGGAARPRGPRARGPIRSVCHALVARAADASVSSSSSSRTPVCWRQRTPRPTCQRSSACTLATPWRVAGQRRGLVQQLQRGGLADAEHHALQHQVVQRDRLRQVAAALGQVARLGGQRLLEQVHHARARPAHAPRRRGPRPAPRRPPGRRTARGGARRRPGRRSRRAAPGRRRRSRTARAARPRRVRPRRSPRAAATAARARTSGAGARPPRRRTGPVRTRPSEGGRRRARGVHTPRASGQGRPESGVCRPLHVSCSRRLASRHASTSAWTAAAAWPPSPWTRPVAATR